MREVQREIDMMRAGRGSNGRGSEEGEGGPQRGEEGGRASVTDVKLQRLPLRPPLYCGRDKKSTLIAVSRPLGQVSEGWGR